MSNDRTREIQSAGFDDELAASEVDELIATSGSDAMYRYNLISDAMRGDVDETSMLDVSAQVRAAIADEPQASRPVERVTKDNSKGLAAWLGLSSWWQPVGGLAVAASVAMVVVVSLDQTEVDTGVTTPQLATTVPTTIDQDAVVNVANEPAVDLRNYLDEHSEFAAQDTMQGRLPYVRSVGYKNADANR